MAKEFDIFLNKRLTECDIIVYSIPFRDGITATNRIVMESCLNYYILQKFVAVQTDSELVAHIDKMIKTCYERLNNGAVIGADAPFEVRQALSAEAGNMVLSVNDIEVLDTMFTEVNSALGLVVSPITLKSAKAVGLCKNGIISTQQIVGTSKNSFLKLSAPMFLEAANLDATHAQKFIDVDNGSPLSAMIQSLCYNILLSGQTVTEIAAMVLGTELRHSFGRGNSALSIRIGVTGTQAQKFETAHFVSTVFAEITSLVARKSMTPEGNNIELNSTASTVIREYRLLSDIDDMVLEDIDDMSLDDLSYITIAE